MTSKKSQEDFCKQQQSTRNPFDRETEDQRIHQEYSRRMRRFLADAIDAKDESRVKELLEQEPKLNPEELGKLLWTPILANEVGIATMLVEAGAKLDVADPSNPTRTSILHKVVEYRDSRHRQLLVAMIERGADVNAEDDCGRNVLFRAISTVSSLKIIKELLKRGARLGHYVSCSALRHPNAIQLFRMLLRCDSFDAGVTRSAWVSGTLCRLMVFKEDRVLPIAKMILDLKLPVEDVDGGGLILERAALSNKIEIVQLLVKYGFNVNKRAFRLTSPLFAASRLQQTTITELLIRAGANVNALGEDPGNQAGRYAIHAACRFGSIDNMRILLRNGADINVRDSERYTPFRSIKSVGSITAKHELVIRHLALIISKGEKVNESDLKIIACHSDMQSYFKRCSGELETMKVKRIVNNIFLFSFFDKNTNKLAFLTRNSNFSKYYDERKKDFPIYREEIDYAFESAVTRKELLKDKEKALCESLEMTLPYVPLEKVVYYFYLNDCK